MLPTDYAARKDLPLYTYLTQYHPDAIIELVKVSVAGNIQHNPGEPMHWARGKSMDQLNTAVRHVMDHGMGSVYDDSEPSEVTERIGPVMHLAKAAWRLMAEMQLLCEARDRGEDITDPKFCRGTHIAIKEAVAALDRDYSLVYTAGTQVPIQEPAKATGSVANASPNLRLLPCGCYGRCDAPLMHNPQPLPTGPTVIVPRGTGPRDPSGRLYADIPGGIAPIIGKGDGPEPPLPIIEGFDPAD
jgi:hypothetical protein